MLGGQAQQSSTYQSIPSKVQANMLHTSRATSDSDEEPEISRACCVQAQTESYSPNEKVVPVQKNSEATGGMLMQEISEDQIRYDSPELESGKRYVVPVRTLAKHHCKIVWKNDRAVKEQNVGYACPYTGEQAMPDDLPELEYDSDDGVDEQIKIPSQDVPFQLGTRPEVVRNGDLIVYSKHLRRCVVNDGIMIQLREFMRGPLRKQSPEVQAKAALKSL
jgi:hypothetical protein